MFARTCGDGDVFAVGVCGVLVAAESLFAVVTQPLCVLLCMRSPKGTRSWVRGRDVNRQAKFSGLGQGVALVRVLSCAKVSGLAPSWCFSGAAPKLLD